MKIYFYGSIFSIRGIKQKDDWLSFDMLLKNCCKQKKMQTKEMSIVW